MRKESGSTIGRDRHAPLTLPGIGDRQLHLHNHTPSLNEGQRFPISDGQVISVESELLRGVPVVVPETQGISDSDQYDPLPPRHGKSAKRHRTSRRSSVTAHDLDLPQPVHQRGKRHGRNTADPVGGKKAPSNVTNQDPKSQKKRSKVSNPNLAQTEIHAVLRCSRRQQVLASIRC